MEMPNSSFKGQFLIAMPGLLDPNFHKTVILISDHNSAGAQGFVINKPHATLTGPNIFDELEVEYDNDRFDSPVFLGGPVQSDEVFIIHGAPFSWDGASAVTSSIAVSNSNDILLAIGRGEGPESFMITVGCAGWGPDQLESEILRNAWLTCPVSFDVMFNTPSEKRWSEAVKIMGIDPALLSSFSGNA